jgi:MOSC domain-containing protein YiiM
LTPTVVALHLCTKSRAPLETVARARAVLETGLEGDRHARKDSRRQVLFIERETLDHFGLAPGDVREQVTVSGLDLTRLVFGARLQIGTATFEVAGPCAPCERMNEVRPGLREALEGRRGRFMRVVGEGVLSVGDPVLAAGGALVTGA